MKKIILVLVAFFVVSIVGYTNAESADQPKWMASPVKEWVEKARATTKQVPITDLKAAIDGNENIVVLDVREPNEYEIAHIPGSINIPRGLIEFSIWAVVPEKEKKIFVYCKTGGRAALATKTLNEIGYSNAVAVNTGGVAWVKAGYPVETSISDDEFVIVPATK